MDKVIEIQKLANEALGMCSERSPRWRAVVLKLEELLGVIQAIEALYKGDEDGLLTDIPTHLPPQYYRECADEDGAMTKYKVVTDKDSYIEGAKSQLDITRREGQEEKRVMLMQLDCCPSYFEMQEVLKGLMEGL